MLTIHPAAVDEMRAAALWYEERAPGLGVRFVDSVLAATNRIAENPRIGAIWQSARLARKGVRRLTLTNFPYLLVYALEAERIVVVAVAHGRRRPGYWLRR